MDDPETRADLIQRLRVDGLPGWRMWVKIVTPSGFPPASLRWCPALSVALVRDPDLPLTTRLASAWLYVSRPVYEVLRHLENGGRGMTGRARCLELVHAVAMSGSDALERLLLVERLGTDMVALRRVAELLAGHTSADEEEALQLRLAPFEDDAGPVERGP